MVAESNQVLEERGLYRLTAYADECFHNIGGKAALGFQLWYVSATVVLTVDIRNDFSDQKLKRAIGMLISSSYSSRLASFSST